MKKFTIFTILIICSIFSACSSKEELQPSVSNNIIPVETLNAISDYIKENAQGLFETVYVDEFDGGANINVYTDLVNLEAFDTICSTVVEAVHIALETNKINLHSLSIMARNSTDNDEYVNWYTSDLEKGILSDTTSGDNIILLGKTIEDIKNRYRTSEQLSPSTTSKTTSIPEPVYHFVANTSTKKFHNLSCSDVKKIKSSNRKDYEETRNYMITHGYDPCGRCKP